MEVSVLSKTGLIRRIRSYIKKKKRKESYTFFEEMDILCINDQPVYMWLMTMPGQIWEGTILFEFRMTRVLCWLVTSESCHKYSTVLK